MSRVAMKGLAFTAMAICLGAAPAAAFDCAPAKCTEMATCAEARYKLYICGHGERDADNDGIPCESLCGLDHATFEARSRVQWPKELPFAARPAPAEGLGLLSPAHAADMPSESLRCDGKRRCGEMNSCEEAQFYLRSCGVSSLDRDRDGVACNSLCGGR